MHDPAPHRHIASAAAPLLPSLLRLSAMHRLAIAAILAVLLWAAVAWALTKTAT